MPKFGRRAAAVFMAVFMLGIFLSGCAEKEPTSKSLRIIATSDLHGKFVPWDYALNCESSSGSVAQLSSAVKEYRTENTLLFDAGDTIQDNCADIFVGSDDVHPMIQAMNAIGYDVCVTGNHEYNYGMDIVRKTVSDFDCKVLTGNVYYENGERVADGYTILEKDGIRIAVIGMVSPNITRWDAANLAGCTVTDPLEETRRIIDKISGSYDVLIGVFHMSLKNDFDLPNSGVNDILESCPEFDVMISAHEHSLIEGMYINGVLVVQNKNMAQTMSVIDLTLSKEGGKWKVLDRVSKIVEIGGYPPDPEITDLIGKYDEQARTDAVQTVGKLTGGPLAPENEIPDIPEAQLHDTALIDLINNVQMYYTDADVSATALFDAGANLFPGDIRKCDTAMIYKYTNTLYKLRMNGRQLKKYMEWSASYYNTFHDGDLTISFDPGIRIYQYDMFEGVNYEIDISQQPGNRIRHLTWQDGTPVNDEDEFYIAVNNYRANTALLAPGIVFGEGEELPVLIESDVQGNIGGIRELIREYIVNVKGGTITPECNENWHLTGLEWDEDLHRRAAEMARSGEIVIPCSEDGRTPNVRSVTENDLAQADPTHN